MHLHTVLTNQLSINDTNCRNETQKGLHNLLQGNQVRGVVRQYCLDKIPYKK